MIGTFAAQQRLSDTLIAVLYSHYWQEFNANVQFQQVLISPIDVILLMECSEVLLRTIDNGSALSEYDT